MVLRKKEKKKKGLREYFKIIMNSRHKGDARYVEK